MERFNLLLKEKVEDIDTRFPNDEYYFKSQEQMKDLFADLPESIENITEIVDKIEVLI